MIQTATKLRQSQCWMRFFTDFKLRRYQLLHALKKAARLRTAFDKLSLACLER